MTPRGRAAAVAGACILFIGPSLIPRSAFAEEPVVSSRELDGRVEIRASAHLGADRETVWRVLTAYDRYASFIPGLRESRVVSRSRGIVIVEQRGSVIVGPLSLPVEMSFRVQEFAPDRVESRALTGPLKSLESAYVVVDTGSGSRLDYVGHAQVDLPLFGGFGRATVEANVTRQFRALVDEIEREAAGSPEAGPARR